MSTALRTPSRLLAVAVLSLAFAGTGITGAGAQTDGSGAKGAAPEATREILVQTAPPAVPGYDLYLMRVTVPPGAELAPHTHPGTQGARIERGVLTYTLISGSATVVRAATRGADATTETVSAPKTVELRRADVVIENPALVHEAANRGARPVVILLTALFPQGAPLSTPAG
jgi:hypothetical protein